MLPEVARIDSRLSRRGRWGLALLVFAVLIVPTWHQEAQSQFQGRRQGEDTTSSTQPSPSAAATTTTNGEPAHANAIGSEGVVGGGGGGGLGGGNPRRLPRVARPQLPAMAPPSVESLPEPTEAETRITEALNELVEFDFQDVPLSEAINMVRDKSQLNIVVHQKSLEENEQTLARKLSMKVSGITLRSVLKLMLEPDNLNFIVEDEVMKIVTEDRYRVKLITKTYPVRDLVSNIDAEYELLMSTVLNSIGGQSEGNPWMQVDGEGGDISPMPGTGCIVVKTTQKGHDDILQLLRALRSANNEMQVSNKPLPMK